MALKTYSTDTDVPLPKADAIHITVPWRGSPVLLSCVGRNSYSWYMKSSKWTAHLIRSVGEVPAELEAMANSGTRDAPDGLLEYCRDAQAALEELLGYEVSKIKTTLLDLGDNHGN